MKKCETCLKEIEVKYGSGRFCSSFCARKFATSKNRKEINKKISIKLKNKYKNGDAYGFLKSKEEYEKNKINKICPICLEKFSVTKCNEKKIYCSKKCYLKDEKLEYRSNSKGGYRKGAGRSKAGYYRGIWCDSTYELVYVIYRIDKGIPFERNSKGFPYKWKGKIHNYYPDFVEGDSYIEIKGYKNDKADAKAKSVPQGVIMLYKEDLKREFEYVKLKYGIPSCKLYELYDGHKPKYEYICNACKIKFSTNTKRKSVCFCSRRCTGKFRAKMNHGEKI